MGYYFYFDDTLLPIPPEKMTVKSSNKNRTIDLINEGEINILKTPGLKEISFDILLPSQRYPFVMDSNPAVAAAALFSSAAPVRPPKEYLELFESYKETKKPFRFIVFRMKPNFTSLDDTNLKVTLENLDVSDAASNGFDRSVTLTLKEYRTYGTQELELVKGEGGKEQYRKKELPREKDKMIDTVYKLKKQQTILEACRLAGGGLIDWRNAAKLNQCSNPIELFEGKVLQLLPDGIL